MAFTQIDLFKLMFWETFKFLHRYQWWQNNSHIICYLEHTPPDFDSKSGFPQKNINDIQESVWGIIKV